MLQTLADLFWNRKTGILHRDFVRGLTILFILAMTGLVNSAGFQLLQVFEFQSLAQSESILELQFYNAISWPFLPDLETAPLLFGCLLLFLKRAGSTGVGTVFAVAAGLLSFLFFRSFTAIVALVSYAAQGTFVQETIGRSLPVAAWVVGALSFCGLASLIFFLVKRIPEDRGPTPVSDRMTSHRLVQTFWLIFFSVLGVELALVVTFATLASFGLFSRETYLTTIAVGSGVTSLVGQIVLAIAFGRRLKDAGLPAWVVLVVLLSLWVVEGLILWGIFSHPPVPLLQALNLALFFVMDLGPLGIIVLILLPSREPAQGRD